MLISKRRKEAKQMMLYRVTFGHQMGLVEAIDADDAEQYIECEVGRMNGPVIAELATDEDTAWFKGMGGGHIYKTPKGRKESLT